MPDSGADELSDIFCEDLLEDGKLGSVIGDKKRVRFQLEDTGPKPISNKRKLDDALSGAFGKYLRVDNPGAPKLKKRRACVLCRQEGHDKRNCHLKVRCRFYMYGSQFSFQSL